MLKDELVDERIEPFAMVDVWVLRNPEITPQCKALYGLLITYGPDRIFPGHERLARELGVTRQTVSKWLRDLRGLHLIDWQRTGRSNRYRILGPPRCKAEHTSDVKPDIHLMQGEANNRCIPEQTRSRSNELDPSTPDPINIPAGAEKPPEPEILLQTENPNSVTNRPVDSGDGNQGSSASTGDYMGDLQRRANGGESWTMPAEAGGADAFRDGVLGAFCWLIGIPKDSLDDDKQGQWAAKFRELASLWDASAEDIRRCILALPESEYHFKSYSVPYQHSFQDDLYVLVARLKGGQPLVKESPRASPGRKRGHRETVWEGEVEQVRQFVEQQEAAAAEEEPLDVEAMLGPEA